MDVLGQGWEVMRPAGSGADLAAGWRRLVEGAPGGKLLPLVLCAVVAPLLQAEPLSSALLNPQPRPAEYWARLPSLVLCFSKLIARMRSAVTMLSREAVGAFIRVAVVVR